ncbi:MAG: GNAT family N-acetyltransferase [Gammaproteobacteria bacterium]
MGILIRLAGPHDAGSVCQILCRSITECCQQDHQNDPQILKAWLGNKKPEHVAGWFTSASNHALIAELDGQPCGVALLTQAGKLSLCYVLPEAQGQGIGKALLQRIECQAQAWGISVVRLHSTATASAFFTHHGYASSGKEKSCFGLDCEFLWKKLDGEPSPDGAGRQRFCKCSMG